MALAAGLAILIAVAFVIASNGSPSVSRPAPALPPSLLTGGAARVASLHGRPAVIDFFASWCGPCSAEAPTLERFARLVGGRATVVAVAWSDSREAALRFVRRFHWTFPVLQDPNGTAGYAYGIEGLPTAFVLDARGQIAERLIGPQTQATLMNAVRAAGGRLTQ